MGIHLLSSVTMKYPISLALFALCLAFMTKAISFGEPGDDPEEIEMIQAEIARIETQLEEQVKYEASSAQQAQCRDDNNNCRSWSRNGECQKNPGYMLINCQKSCDVCSDVCNCMNPWNGLLAHYGDPANTCSSRNFCYVSCSSDCRDRRLAQGRGRCWSRVACNDDPKRSEK